MSGRRFGTVDSMAGAAVVHRQSKRVFVAREEERRRSIKSPKEVSSRSTISDRNESGMDMSAAGLSWRLVGTRSVEGESVQEDGRQSQHACSDLDDDRGVCLSGSCHLELDAGHIFRQKLQLFWSEMMMGKT